MTANLSPAMAEFKKNNPKGFASLLVPRAYALSIISDHGIDGESFKSFDNALYWYRELAQYLGKNGKRYYKLDIELYNYYNDILPLTIPQTFQLEAAKSITPTIDKWDHHDVREKVREASARDKPSKGEWCASVGGVETAKYIKDCLGKRLKNVTKEMVANYEQTEKAEAVARKERTEAEQKQYESQKRARMLEWKIAEAKRLAEESRRLAEAAKRYAEEADRLDAEEQSRNTNGVASANETTQTPSKSVDFNKVRRIENVGNVSNGRMGVQIGYCVINQPMSQKDHNNLRILREDSQDLLMVKGGNPEGRLPVQEKMALIKKFVAADLQQYQDFLVENAFVMYTFMREDGEPFILLTDFDCGIRLRAYLEAVNGLKDKCDHGGWVNAQMPDLDEFYLNQFMIILEKEFIVAEKLPNRGLRLKRRIFTERFQ